MSHAWMPFYVADYLADTVHLSAAENGAYLLLIMHYWQKRGLPSDDRTLARIARMTDREWKAARPVLVEFFSDGWKHDRIETELQKADRKSDARAEAGSRGGTSKALKNKKPEVAIATDLPSNCLANGVASSSHPQSEQSSLRSDCSAPKRAKRRERIAEDAQPDEINFRDAEAAGMDRAEMRVEWPKFRDHHRAKGSTMADWHAAWRTWCHNWRDFRSRKPPPETRRRTAADSVVDLARKISERNNGSPSDSDNLPRLSDGLEWARR